MTEICLCFLSGLTQGRHFVCFGYFECFGLCNKHLQYKKSVGYIFLIFVSDIQFRLGVEKEIPQSICSLPCKFGEMKKYVEWESCCWTCHPCAKYQVRQFVQKVKRIYHATSMSHLSLARLQSVNYFLGIKSNKSNGMTLGTTWP